MFQSVEERNTLLLFLHMHASSQLLLGWTTHTAKFQDQTLTQLLDLYREV